MRMPGIFFWGTIATFTALAYCSRDVEKTHVAAVPPAPPMPAVSEADILRKVADVDLRPYDKATYPKAWAQIGPHLRDGTFQKLRTAAARDMAASSDCDKVELVEHSLTRSTPSNPVVFVDCRNTFRRYYDLEWLATLKPAQTPHLPAASGSSNPKERLPPAK